MNEREASLLRGVSLLLALSEQSLSPENLTPAQRAELGDIVQRLALPDSFSENNIQVAINELIASEPNVGAALRSMAEDAKQLRQTAQRAAGEMVTPPQPAGSTQPALRAPSKTNKGRG